MQAARRAATWDGEWDHNEPDERGESQVEAGRGPGGPHGPGGFDRGRRRGLAAVSRTHRPGTFDRARAAARVERVPERGLEGGGAGRRMVLSRNRGRPGVDHLGRRELASRPGIRPGDRPRSGERRGLPGGPIRKPQSQEQQGVADAHRRRRSRLCSFRGGRDRRHHDERRDCVAHSPSLRVTARRRRIAGTARRTADRQLRRECRRGVRGGPRCRDGKDTLEDAAALARRAGLLDAARDSRGGARRRRERRRVPGRGLRSRDRKGNLARLVRRRFLERAPSRLRPRAGVHRDWIPASGADCGACGRRR
jgi:hypothetical protein